VKRVLPGWLSAPRLDLPLLAALLLLMLGGLAVLYSATGQDSGLVYRQSARLLLGLAVMLMITQVPPRIIMAWTPWLYGAGLLLVAATWFIGVGAGAQRWLDVGLLRFQPAEIMKLAVPMMVAWYLHPRILPPGWKDIAVTGLILLLPAALIAQQPDLGTALLVAVSGCLVLFLAGLRWRFIISLAVLAAAAAPAVWMVMQEYQRDRVRTFLRPEADPLGTGWNIIQSKIAVGSGGLAGKGWLNGTQ
jgi:rod shape determining protein RodA